MYSEMGVCRGIQYLAYFHNDVFFFKLFISTNSLYCKNLFFFFLFVFLKKNNNKKNKS